MPVQSSEYSVTVRSTVVHTVRDTVYGVLRWGVLEYIEKD